VTQKQKETIVRCYIFDIDGTLADCTHRLPHIQKTPKDWRAFFAACSGDAPIPHIIALAQDLDEAGVEIVYVSGRSDECRMATLEWMSLHGVPEGTLFMRKEGDHRDDDIVKAEILAKLREQGLEPLMAFDDRNRVVAQWRKNGVPCAQVADGDF
jgi:phosphoglycolate phosphatase-like HAD superfamily hydrolase